MLILRPKKWVGYILILFTQRHYILDSALNAGDAWLAGVLKSSNLLFKRVSRWTSSPSYKHKKNPSKFQLNTWRDWQVFKLNTWRDFSISASLREASSTLNGNLVNVVSDQSSDPTLSSSKSLTLVHSFPSTASLHFPAFRLQLVMSYIAVVTGNVLIFFFQIH